MRPNSLDIHANQMPGWAPTLINVYAWIFCIACASAFFYRAIDSVFPVWAGNVASVADEVAVLMALTGLIYNATYTGRTSKWLVYLVGIVAISLILTALAGDSRPWSARLLQAGIHLKLPLLLLIMTLPGWSQHAAKPANFALRLIVTISIIGFIWSLVSPAQFEQLFDVDVKTRLGLPRTGGLSLMPNDLAILFTLLALGHALSIAGGAKRVWSAQTVVIVPVVLLVVGMSGSRAGLFGCLLYLGCLAFLDRSRISLLVSIFLVAGLVAVLQPLIVSTIELTLRNLEAFRDIENTRYIRGIMIFYGISLASQHFPFGAGLATFGSVMSAGSITYADLNVQSMYFFTETHGIFDSNVASLLGELGYLITAAIYYITGQIIYILAKRLYNIQFNSVIPMVFVGYVLSLSLVYPIFTYGPSIVIIALMLSMNQGRNARYR